MIIVFTCPAQVMFVFSATDGARRYLVGGLIPDVCENLRIWTHLTVTCEGTLPPFTVILAVYELAPLGSVT